MFPTTFETWWDYALWLALTVGASLLLLVSLLVIIAFLLLMDRKVWAAVQLRRGPNVVGPFGLLQSFADLLKFVLKEPVIPASSDKALFLHGAVGYTWEHDLQFPFKRVKSDALLFGSSEAYRDLLIGELLAPVAVAS